MKVLSFKPRLDDSTKEELGNFISGKLFYPNYVFGLFEEARVHRGVTWAHGEQFTVYSNSWADEVHSRGQTRQSR